MYKNILVVDPIAFRGGSKVATEAILEQFIKENINVIVLSRDKSSWKKDNIKRHSYIEFPFLSRCESGFGYFIRHAFIALFIFFIWLRHLGKLHLLGASGPGVDVSIYLLEKIIPIKIIQLIHGPVAPSRTIGRCLLKADIVAYLPSAKPSIIRALSLVTTEEEIPAVFKNRAYIPMINGLTQRNWPKMTEYKHQKPRVLWAASLLKWKGLDLLLDALAKFRNHQLPPETTVCYIRPKGTDLDVSRPPVNTEHLQALESPANLDEIRSQHHIFVSTSHQEPFGLSILEAMAAGMCVLIPDDGAYWDGILQDGVDCIKYTANDADDLYQKLFYLSRHLVTVKKIGKKACLVAQNYRAEFTYEPIIKQIKFLDSHPHHPLHKTVGP